MIGHIGAIAAARADEAEREGRGPFIEAFELGFAHVKHVGEAEAGVHPFGEDRVVLSEGVLGPVGGGLVFHRAALEDRDGGKVGVDVQAEFGIVGVVELGPADAVYQKVLALLVTVDGLAEDAEADAAKLFGQDHENEVSLRFHKGFEFAMARQGRKVGGVAERRIVKGAKRL